jgi:small subunit ribosomal protein S6
MRPYETMIVLSPTLGADMQPLIERVQEVIRSRGGQIDASHDWGSKKLAHPIRKQSDGHYFLIEYQAEGDAVAEVERTLRITDGVLRYISVQQEHTGLPQPRARESSRREDVPLSELRSHGSEPAAPEEGASAGATAEEQPSEQSEQTEQTGQTGQTEQTSE